ncbi:MAG: DNA modification methylase [Candidatus Helarchaeota archaeon]
MEKLVWHNEIRKPNDLLPYEENPRQMTEEQALQLKKSLEKFNLVEVPAIDTDNKICAGHQRVKILQLLGRGDEDIDVRVPNRKLTDEEFREYNARSNRNTGDWNWDMLANCFDKDELVEWGFDKLELSKEFDLRMPISEDEAPEVDETKEPESKLGEVYELGRHRLMCGDSTKAEDVEKLMNGKKADMVFTDPPWNVAIGLDSNPPHRQREGLENDKLSQGEFDNFISESFGNVKKYLSGDIYCVLGNKQMPMLDASLRSIGFHWSSIIVWVKDTFVLGPSKYHSRYEPIWYGWPEDQKSSYCGDRKQDDVWEIKRPRVSKEHSTMKPIALCVKAIKNSSKQGDIVLDLFGGSGSTLIAAEQTNRICYMMELGPKYCDVIKKRYENFKTK